MSKNFTRLSLVLILISALGYYFASPYLVLNKIRNAAEQNDSATVSRYIDYAQIRESLKIQIKNKIDQNINQKGYGDLGKLSALLTGPVAEKLVDAMVTEDSINLIFQGKALSETEYNLPSILSQTSSVQATQNNPWLANSATNVASNSPQSDLKAKEKTDFKMAYQSIHRFVVNIDPKQNQAFPFDVVMTREGLSWKVTDIRLDQRDE